MSLGPGMGKIKQRPLHKFKIFGNRVQILYWPREPIIGSLGSPRSKRNSIPDVKCWGMGRDMRTD